MGLFCRVVGQHIPHFSIDFTFYKHIPTKCTIHKKKFTHAWVSFADTWVSVADRWVSFADRRVSFADKWVSFADTQYNTFHILEFISHSLIHFAFFKHIPRCTIHRLSHIHMSMLQIDGPLLQIHGPLLQINGPLLQIRGTTHSTFYKHIPTSTISRVLQIYL